MTVNKLMKATAALLAAILISLPAAGLEKTDDSLLKALKQAEPELFEQIEVVEEGDRKLLKVGLSDVLKLVLKRSLTLEASRLGERAAVEGMDAARGIFQPVLSASASNAKSAAISSSASSFGADNASTNYLTTYSTDATTLSTTLSKKNPSGISFSTTLSSTISKTDTWAEADKGDTPEEVSSLDAYDSSSLSARVSIPVFKDWGDINEVSIRRSELVLDQSRVSTHTTGISLLESVARTYWTLVGYRENVRTLEEAVALSEQLVKETRTRVEVGKLSPTDLKEAETQLATNQKELLSKQIDVQEIEDQIRIALNLGVIPYGLQPADLPKIHREGFRFETLLNKAYAASDTLKNYQLSLKSNQLDLDEAYNNDKTDLDLSVSYTINGWGENTTDSFQEFSNEQHQGYSVGLTWTVPLFDKTTQKTIQKRRIERSRLELQIQDTKSQIHVELQTLLRNLKLGVREQATAQQSVNLAGELMQQEIKKLKLGKSTSYNVSQAQKSYRDARLSETLVRTGNEQSFISLLVLTGELFNYFGLQETI